jgi:hypothetical protein
MYPVRFRIINHSALSHNHRTPLDPLREENDGPTYRSEMDENLPGDQISAESYAKLHFHNVHQITMLLKHPISNYPYKKLGTPSDGRYLLDTLKTR